MELRLAVNISSISSRTLGQAATDRTLTVTTQSTVYAYSRYKLIAS